MLAQASSQYQEAHCAVKDRRDRRNVKVSVSSVLLFTPPRSSLLVHIISRLLIVDVQSSLAMCVRSQVEVLPLTAAWLLYRLLRPFVTGRGAW